MIAEIFASFCIARPPSLSGKAPQRQLTTRSETALCTGRMPQWLRSAWLGWKRIAEKIGHFQARVLFGLMYFVVVTPFAVGVKVLSDPLSIKKRGPRWRDFARQTLTLEDARRQF